MSFADTKTLSSDVDLLTVEPDLFKNYQPTTARLSWGTCNFNETECLAAAPPPVNGNPWTTDLVGLVMYLGAPFDLATIINSVPDTNRAYLAILPGYEHPDIGNILFNGGSTSGVPFIVQTFQPIARRITADLMRSLGLDPTNPDHFDLLTPGQNCIEWSTLAVMAEIYKARASSAIATDADFHNLEAQASLYRSLAARAFNRMRLTVEDPQTGVTREIVPGHIQLTRA